MMDEGGDVETSTKVHIVGTIHAESSLAHVIMSCHLT